MKIKLLLMAFLMPFAQLSAVSPVFIGSIEHFCEEANSNGKMSNDVPGLCILSSPYGSYACKQDTASIKCKPYVVKKKANKSRMTDDEIRAKRLAEWNRAHPKKSTKKAYPKKKLNFSSLPKQCGNFTVYHGKVKYHRLEKAYYIEEHYSNRANEFRLSELDQVEKLNLLGKTIIFLGNSHSLYPPGGRQKGAFRVIITDINVLQIVNNKIDLKKIRETCANYN